MFVSSHDDAYVWVEARDVHLSRHLGRRLLTIAAGTHVFDGAATIDVVEPSLDLVASVLGAEQAFSCPQDSIRRTDTTVEVLLVRQYRKPFEVLVPTHVLAYQWSGGTWAIDEIG